MVHAGCRTPKFKNKFFVQNYTSTKFSTTVNKSVSELDFVSVKKQETY